jgi:hypothetical protein
VFSTINQPAQRVFYFTGLKSAPLCQLMCGMHDDCHGFAYLVASSPICVGLADLGTADGIQAHSVLSDTGTVINKEFTIIAMRRNEDPLE